MVSSVLPPHCWWDLCAGPHLNSTGDINPDAFALESVAGAYWRGDETEPQLQRIYGTAWANAFDQMRGSVRLSDRSRDFSNFSTVLYKT